MKPRLLSHIVCPLDKTPLELRAWESTTRTLSSDEHARAERMGIDPASLTTEVQTGVLVNAARKIYYPIHGGVPRLLAFRTGLGEQFAEQHAQRLATELPGYGLPNESGMPGEQDVLRTFSSEWLNYDWDGEAYWNQTPEAWFRSMDYVLELDEQPVRDGLVLEVGVGIGGVADHVARDRQCELVGIDLGYSVDVAFKHFGSNPFLHLAQASAFTPPFAVNTFDFVYSFGVIHHTFSTKTAFDSLARLPKSSGRLYIWVYSPYHEQRNLIRRGMMALERVVRPIVWRLPERAQSVALAPLVPLYMGYQWMRRVRGGKAYVHYGVREALHAARDRFTPRYIHRHAEDEVCGWFEQAGYDRLSRATKRDWPEFVPIGFITCTGVSGIRR